MRRDVNELSGRRFDLLVVGGGIYGACIARDAALRGLAVALIDKSDFCSGTSHNSLKIVHSGIRYFQHLDFRRIRESIGERRIWLSLAPHLVRPLKFVIPTQGYLVRGPLALQAAILMHRLIGFDWNHGVPERSRIPIGRVQGRDSLSSAIPGLPRKGLSGTASWYDGQVIDADRVVLECIQSAVGNGASVANYVAAESLLRANGSVHGVSAIDRTNGNEFEIRAKMTVNAAGPWIQKILQRSLGGETASTIPPLAKNMNVVVRRPLPEYGVGIPSKRISDAVIGSESRLFFITPWKDVAVIGTTHFPYEGDPDDYRTTEEEIADFLDEINESYPPAKLSMQDVLYVYSGLTPAEPNPAKGDVGRSKHAEIIDHAGRDGCEGLLSVIGVKFTTGRLVAERVVSLAQEKLGISASAASARTVPLPGAADRAARHERKEGVPNADVADLLGRYGGNLPSGFVEGAGEFREALAACVQHAVDSEMALTLEDFLLRRNDLAARGRLTEPLVRLAAEQMSRGLGWSVEDREASINRLCASLRYLASPCPDGRDVIEKHGTPA